MELENRKKLEKSRKADQEWAGILFELRPCCHCRFIYTFPLMDFPAFLRGEKHILFLNIYCYHTLAKRPVVLWPSPLPFSEEYHFKIVTRDLT